MIDNTMNNMSAKPFVDACDRNREPILKVLKRYLTESLDVWEIGSGTGQHAVYMAQHLPDVHWHTSELPPYHAGICAWIADAGLTNVHPPVALDVNSPRWPIEHADAIYTANTLHIFSWREVQAFFRGVEERLAEDGLLFVYGPFNYDGRYTSAGNRALDEFLQRTDPASRIRDFEHVDALAVAAGLSLVDDHPLPANNRLVVWQRIAHGSASPDTLCHNAP